MKRESLIKKLIANIKCGVCGKPYRPGNIRILGQKDNLWFLSVFCPACHALGLVAAVIKEEVVEGVTDLTEDELAKFKKKEPVGADDVLDMHEFLRNFNGDVATMFSKD